MKKIILVAGATGDLGGRIIKALLQHGVSVRAIVRQSADNEKVKALEASGVEVVKVDMSSDSEMRMACEDVACIVSALQGLRDVIVNTQTVLLNAAIAAGVPRFIPSDFSTDFTKLVPGTNRNFDLRREFDELLDQSQIKATSIFNGAFAEILSYNIPFLDFKKKMIGYWEDADWQVDFTTMNDTAAFTAAAALDNFSPRYLHISGFQVSANELKQITESVLREQFNVVSMGSRADLAAQISKDRLAQPEGENEVYPNWQRAQYMLSMFSAHNEVLDNERYPGIRWSGAEDVLRERR